MGLKGDPGESISSPEVTVSPVTQTVTQNQTATFNCSVRGSPKPKVTWSKVNGSLVAGSFVSDKNGALKITKSTFSDSGDYMCIAVNVLGSDERTATLIVEGKKKKKKNFFKLFILFFFLFNVSFINLFNRV